MGAAGICKHCGTDCGPILARGLGRRCYNALRHAGELDAYPRTGIKVRTKPVKYPITPEMHEQIRAVYLSDTGAGQVSDLAQQLGLPRWQISHYAVVHGWTVRHRKEPNWSPEELRLLKEFVRYTPAVIQRKLRERGYARSVPGIILKRKRAHYLQDFGGISAVRLAAYLGVDVHFVTRAIQDGRLSAQRRGTERNERQGGDSWFITPGDIRAYIIADIHEIDIRKVDKYWLVDVLTRPEVSDQDRPGTPAVHGHADMAQVLDAVHLDDAYFYCARQRCTLKKAVCIKRQTEGTGDIRVQCDDCAQGREIAKAA